MSDLWIDNIDKKVLFRWMICEYIKDWSNTRVYSKEMNLRDFKSDMSVHLKYYFNVYTSEGCKYIDKLIEEDSILNNLKYVIQTKDNYSCVNKDNGKLEWINCSIEFDLNNVKEEDVTKTLGLLHILGYADKIKRIY